MRKLAAGTLAVLISISPGAAHALSKCAAKISTAAATLGDVEVQAATVGANLRWGKAVGRETSAFANAATCISGTSAKKCLLGASGSVDARTPPASCVLYLADDSGSCSAQVKGCVARPPGAYAIDGNGTVIGPASAQPDGTVATLVTDPDGHAYALRVVQEIAEQPGGSDLIAPGNLLNQLLYADLDCLGQAYVLNDPAANGRRSLAVTRNGTGSIFVHLPAGPPTARTISGRAPGNGGCITLAPPQGLSVSTPLPPLVFVKPIRVVVE